MTTPAETLRSAAELMRRRAGNAPPGPWRVQLGHLGGMPEYVMSADGDGAVTESWRERGTAQHVAGMHPLVALAVAAWLAAEAERAEGLNGWEDSDAYPLMLENFTHPLKVARAYLGEMEPS